MKKYFYRVVGSLDEIEDYQQNLINRGEKIVSTESSVDEFSEIWCVITTTLTDEVVNQVSDCESRCYVDPDILTSIQLKFQLAKFSLN
jgi:hypothetical protein